MVLGATVRLFYSLRHGGRTIWAIPIAATLAVALAFALEPDEPADAGPPTQTELEEGRAVFASAGCGSCPATLRRRCVRHGGAEPRRCAALRSAGRIRRSAPGGKRCPRSRPHWTTRRSPPLRPTSPPSRARIARMLEITAAGSRSARASRRRAAPPAVAAFRPAPPPRVEDHPRALERGRAGSRSETSTSVSGPRTPPATAPGRAGALSGGVSETEILLAYSYVNFASKRASWPATTSPRSSTATRTCGRWV